MFACFYFAPLILLAVTVLYPMFMSVKAVENGKGRTRWLIYWFLFHSLSTTESLFGFLFNLIPGYTMVKCLYLCWCMIPSKSNGCNFSYRVIRPTSLTLAEMVEPYFGQFQTIFPNSDVLTPCPSNPVPSSSHWRRVDSVEEEIHEDSNSSNKIN